MSDALAKLVRAQEDVVALHEFSVLSERDALMAALFAVPAVRRIVTNQLTARKQWVESGRPTIRHFEDWLANVHPDSLADWYWRWQHYDVEVFEALLDAKYGLV